ncbi:hypothetical protein [Embleya sp. NPDC001921]
MSENCSASVREHDPRTCPLCEDLYRVLRHPSQQRTRRALAAFPRQVVQAGTGRASGGGR